MLVYTQDDIYPFWASGVTEVLYDHHDHVIMIMWSLHDHDHVVSDDASQVMDLVKKLCNTDG
jgi:hypothetical protein